MKRDDALKLSEQALTELSSSLRDGKSDTLLQYLAFLGRFHRYSFGNVMLIYSQFPEAEQVAGFTSWKRLGRHVKSGEKGIGILAPLVYKRKDDEPNDESSSGKALRGFRVVHVFDVSQTQGKELPEFARVSGDPGENLDRLRAAITAAGIALAYESGLMGGATGLSRGGEIVVRANLSHAQEFNILVHEYAHELLHRGERRAETTKIIRETEAEAVAYVVSQAVGLDCSTHSSDYIQLYSGDTQLLSASLDHIQAAATKILTALEALPVAEKVAVNG